MRVAVCEDDREQAGAMSECVLRHPKAESCEVYHSAEGLLAAYASGERFGLAFMDIRMDGKGGFRAAEELKRDYPDERPLIVFVTVSDDYALSGYGVAWQYLLKPAGIGEVHHFIDLAAAEIEGHSVLLETAGGNAVVDTRKIICAESQAGTVRIHAVGESHTTRLTLSAVSALLPRGVFAQAHKSYLVNLAHVARPVRRKEIVMSNGAAVPVGRRYKPGFEAALKAYLRGGSDAGL